MPRPSPKFFSITKKIQVFAIEQSIASKWNLNKEKMGSTRKITFSRDVHSYMELQRKISVGITEAESRTVITRDRKVRGRREWGEVGQRAQSYN